MLSAVAPTRFFGSIQAYEPARFRSRRHCHRRNSDHSSYLHGCPCGYYGDSRRPCVCSPTQIRRYLMRISGPLLDRIDIHIEVPRLSPQELMTKSIGESSATVRRRVCQARARQVERLQSDGISCNAQMRARQLRAHTHLDAAAHDLLKTAINQLAMSARAYDRILKVGRTIADLDGSDIIQLHHIAEAINYRTMDRKLFG
ncbi:MAG: ATP-binding protein [Armatimonadota bacterium]|nr:ATP-binding protein [Armatimonadota bacterium]